MAQPSSFRSLPGGFLADPTLVVALAILALNDHVLRPQLPGWIPNKLSDVAGMVLFPALLVAPVEALEYSRRRKLANPRWFLVAVAATGSAFAAVKTSSLAAHVYGASVGVVRWAATLPLHGLAPAAGPVPVSVVVDPTDLLALPFLLVPLWVARRWRTNPPGITSE